MDHCEWSAVFVFNAHIPSHLRVKTAEYILDQAALFIMADGFPHFVSANDQLMIPLFEIII